MSSRMLAEFHSPDIAPAAARGKLPIRTGAA